MGMVWAAIAFWGKASGEWAAAFGGCVRRGIGVSREAAKTRRGPRGKANFDMINMIDMIFDGLGRVPGLRWVRRVAADMVGDGEREWFHAERSQRGAGGDFSPQMGF